LVNKEKMILFQTNLSRHSLRSMRQEPVECGITISSEALGGNGYRQWL
jgi:hypothetical protein